MARHTHTGTSVPEALQKLAFAVMTNGSMPSNTLAGSIISYATCAGIYNGWKTENSRMGKPFLAFAYGAGGYLAGTLLAFGTKLAYNGLSLALRGTATNVNHEFYQSVLIGGAMAVSALHYGSEWTKVATATSFTALAGLVVERVIS